MNYILKKRAQKYLDSVDSNTRKKLYKAIEKLARWEGDIVPLEGQKNRYRYKLDHCRILFEWRKDALVILIVDITTRTNAYKRR